VLAARSLGLAALLLALLPGPAWGQGSIDPLRRPPERAGLLEYEFGVDVFPGGGETVGKDDRGQPLALVQQRYTLMPQVAFRYAVNERWSMRAAAGTSIGGWRRGDGHHGLGAWQWSAGSGFGSVGVGWRWAPGTDWDPRLDVQWHLGPAPQAEAHLSVSRLRDPVVLTGGLGVLAARAAWEPGGTAPGLGVVTAAKAAFVANQRVSFVAGVSHLLPAGVLQAPATTLTFGVHYALDGVQQRTVSWETVLVARGGALDMGFRVSWMGRRVP